MLFNQLNVFIDGLAKRAEAGKLLAARQFFRDHFPPNVAGYACHRIAEHLSQCNVTLDQHEVHITRHIDTLNRADELTRDQHELLGLLTGAHRHLRARKHRIRAERWALQASTYRS